MSSSFDLASTQLLAQNQLSSAHLASALGLIGAHQVDYADLYFQHTINESWQLEEGIVKAGSFNIDQGVGVRAVSGDKTAFAYADAINEDSLQQAALAVRAIAQAGQTQTVAVATRQDSRQLYAPNNPILSLAAAQKVALLTRVDQMARAADPRVTQVMASLSCEYDTVLLARLDGKQNADIRPLVRVSVMVIVSQNGRKEQASSGGGGRFDLAYFSDEKLAEYVHNAVTQAVTNLDAKPAPAGEMTVVLGSGWPGVLLHEAVGHGLEGDFNRKGTSAFSDKMGQQVAAKGVTILDDGTLSERRGSLNMDDEGNMTQATTLIEDGVLVGYMQDEMNARLMGQSITGNGRRESYASIPMPRMTNTYMQSGEYEPDEIIASVQNGIYAVNFGGGQVDITSGKFVFSASEAWRIENGRLTHPVKGATIVGNGPEVMNHVSMIGNDMALDSGVGVCGKEGQSVPVGVGQPTMRIDAGLTVGGSDLS
ncbi:metalloprotease TldD [Neisseriaceae bacterium CLB008]|nr:metalloprotease TldD [Neisseriaceae bacterium]